MGARLVVRFKSGYSNETPETMPRVYLHHGGEYVEDAKETLDAFIAAVKQLDDTRLDDASYLAAKLIVWEAHKQTSHPRYGSDNPLDFLSIGVVTSDSWGDAVVEVDCAKGDGSYTVVDAIDIEEHAQA